MMAEQVRSKAVPRSTSFSAPFWAAGKNGKFLLQRDPETGKFQFFPRPVALWGSRRTPEWVEAKGTGRLIAMTQTTMAATGFEDEAPYYLAIAALDEGPRVFAQMIGNSPEPKIGDRVRIVWQPHSGDHLMFHFELI